MTRIAKHAKQTASVRAVFRGDERCTFVRAIYEPGGSYGPHRQRAHQLVVMLQGEAVVQMQRGSIVLREGEGILAQPGWRVFYQFSREQQSIHTGCQVEGSCLSKSERLLLAGVRGVHPVPAAVHTLIGEGLASPATGGKHFFAAMVLLAKACLLRFAAHVLESPGSGSPLHPALGRALEVLQREPVELHTAGELAERCGVSVSRLRQLFREAGKDSPSALLWQIKTGLAVRMIRSTGLTLGEIADQSGFANPFHLSRSVKKLTGLPPRELRRVEWEGDR
ncbi:MAG: helix-turn-helix domain-containing protein [Terrimicrobiaceae bacterium]